ncbi:MAG TPA: hypothetical protein VGQ83_25605 [Polyangia bacterium]|jgi:hypothetical protein
MPRPLEICLEDLDLTPEDDRYLRCVALPGGEPGLALDREGVVRWMPDAPAAYGLWVSADDRLILLRADGATPLTVTRGERSIEAPAAKPVVLLDQDLLRLGGRRLRVHVHGATDLIHAPEPLRGSAFAGVVRAAAAALALSAAGAVGTAAASPRAVAPIEVRQAPPAPVPMREVICTVTSMKASAKGQVVRASCPANHRVGVGTSGTLLDAKGADIKNATVVVTEAKGNAIVGETSLKEAVPAAKVRFYVSH